MPLTAHNRALYALIFGMVVVAAFAILTPEAENNEIAELRHTAEQGDAKAQFNLGVIYYNGKGVTQDYTEAIGWFRRAAEQGPAQAQFALGLAYAQGKGVPLDYPKAIEWYRLASGQGDADAQYNLGLMYTDGLGVPPDYIAAYTFLDHAIRPRDTGYDG